MLASLCLYTSVSARIKFGDKNSGIRLASGATLNMATDVSMDGTLTKESGSTISGDGLIAFEGGVFDDEDTASNLTGTYDPANNKILLNGNKRLLIEPGTVLAAVEVDGAGNVLKGSPTFQNAVTLVDSDSALSLGVQTSFNQNIVLNGGALTLTSDLWFADDEFVVGPGSIDTATRTLHTGGVALSASTDLTLKTTSHIELNAPVTLAGVWAVEGNVRIAGNGVPFDLSTGQIVIGAGATLTLSDMQLLNVGMTSGEAPELNIKFMDAASKLIIERVHDMRFAADTTYTTGTIEVAGNSRMSLGVHQVLFDGAALRVNGARLSYLSLVHEFAAVNADAITLINQGELEDLNGDFARAPVSLSQGSTLTTNMMLDAYNTLTLVANEAGQLTIDFAGHALAFSNTTDTQLAVTTPGEDTAEAYLTNVVIKDFIPDAITTSATATVTYGANSRLVLGADQTTTQTLTFDGACVLDGSGHSLTISESNGIEIKEGSSLLIKNMTLRGVSGTALQCLATTGSVTCENVTFVLADDTTFDTGSLQIKDRVTLMGGKRFSYASAQTATINAHSSLVIARDTTYVYSPSDETRAALQFTDDTSRMVFEADATFEVANSGVLLTKGVIAITNTATFTSLATELAGAITLGDGETATNNVAVKISPGAKLIVDDGVLQIDDALVIGAG